MLARPKFVLPNPCTRGLIWIDVCCVRESVISFSQPRMWPGSRRAVRRFSSPGVSRLNNTFPMLPSVFSTVSAELHRRRRAAISSFFSKKSVAEFEATIYHNIHLMLGNVDRQTAQDGIAEMRTNYLAFTTDTVTGLCFRRPLGLLEDDEQAVAWRETTAAVASLTPLAKQFRWLVPIALKIPMFILEGLVPSLSRIVKLRHVRKKSMIQVSLS